MREVGRDRDFVKTPEGFFFCVVGYTHPKDRLIAYRKYVPSKGGHWAEKGTRFRRTMPSYTTLDLAKNMEELKEKYPRYVFSSRVFGIEMSEVPKVCITRYYGTGERLKELMKMRMNDLDQLQKKALELVYHLSEASNVPKEEFGVTGSLLINIHNLKFSDIDLVVYGKDSSGKLKETLLSLLKEDKEVRRLPKNILHKWCTEKSRWHNVTYGEARGIYERKWNYGSFKDKIFSVHPVRKDEEIREKYGDRVYASKGLAKVRCRVADDTEAYFLPHTYGVENVRVEEGMEVEEIREVTSYEGFYSGFLGAGEDIVARGKLEEVFDRKKEEHYHRLLIGSFAASGRDFIKPVTL